MSLRNPENVALINHTEKITPSIVGGNVYIGNNCHIEGHYDLGYFTAIGDNVISGSRLKTGIDCLIKNSANLGTDVTLCSNTVVGNECILENNVTVYTGSRIPDGTTIFKYGDVYPDENDPENRIIVYYPEKEPDTSDPFEIDI